MRQFIAKHYPNLFFATIISYFSYFWFNVLRFNKSGDLFIQQSNIWADWALHFTFGSSFSERSLLLKENPLLIGSTLTYPPLADWFSAILIKLQVPFYMSFVLPSFLFTVLFVGMLYLFLKHVINSKKIAITATILFLLNGGLGFIYFIKDITSSTTPLKTILFPPREYTDLASEGIHFMSFLTSMVYPQRNFTIGFPLVLMSLGIIYLVLIRNVPISDKLKTAALIVSGILLGISPFIHPHSSLVAAFVLLSWFFIHVIDHKKELLKGEYKIITSWLGIGIVAIVTALPAIIWYLSNTPSANNFIAFDPGFMSSDSPYIWPIYWIINWGVVPILALIGFVLSWKNNRQLSKTLLPFVLIFFIANVWRFQPWMWDNMKLIAWSAVGICGFAAITLAHLWQKKIVSYKLLAILLFIISTSSGAIELVRNIEFSSHPYVMYTAEELELAEWVKNNTSKSGVWLTSDHSNNWVYNLTGRQTVIAYPGWLSSHGMNSYTKIQQDYLIMFSQPAEYPELFEKYQIKYASIGPHEKFFKNAQAGAFQENFQLIKQTSHYQLFEIRP